MDMELDLETPPRSERASTASNHSDITRRRAHLTHIMSPTSPTPARMRAHACPPMARYARDGAAHEGGSLGRKKEFVEPSVKAMDPADDHVRVEMEHEAVEPVGTWTLDRGGGRRHAPVAQPEQKWSRTDMPLPTDA